MLGKRRVAGGATDRDEYAMNVSKLISSQRGCVGDGDSSATDTQTLICIILCVVREVTASAGSYLKERGVHATLCECAPGGCLCVTVPAASSHHLAGQVASPSPVISVSMS